MERKKLVPTGSIQDRRPTMRWLTVSLALLLAVEPVALVLAGSTVALAAGPAGEVAAPAAQTVLAVVGAQGAELRESPEGAVIVTLNPGDLVQASARNSDGSWVKGAVDSGEEGWLDAASLVAFGLDQLPVDDAGNSGDDGDAAATPTRAAVKATNTPAAAVTESPTEAPTQAPTATPTPTAVPPTPTPVPPTPTSVPPTPVPTATKVPATPTRVPSSAGSAALAVVGAGGADLLDGPDGAVIASVEVAESVTLLGRNSDSSWLMVESAAGDQGWVAAAAIVAFGVETLPVMGEDAAVEEAAGTEIATEATPVATEEATEEALPAAENAADAVPAEEAAAGESAVMADSGVVVTVATDGLRLNIRSGPGSSYPVIGKARNGDQLAALARDEESAWIMVEAKNLAGGFGWAAVELVSLSAPAGELEVSAEVNDEAEAPLSPPFVTAVGTAVPAPRPAAPAATSVPEESSGSEPVATPVATLVLTPAAAAPAAQPAVVRTGATGLAGRMVIHDGRGNIYLYDLGRGELRWLTNGYDPEISRDGEQVVFARSGGANGIWIMNADGSNERRIFDEGEILRSPKWSPDGRWVVYSRLRGEYKCYDIEFLGCLSLAQLIEKFPFLAIPGVPNPFTKDAERLSFPNWGLSRVSVDGGDFRDIAALDSAVAPDWNEAGIVYQSAAGLEVTEDKEGADTRSIFQENWDHDPDWAPNGGRVIFQSKEGPHWEIWSINPDGSGIVALTRPETTLVDAMPSNASPAWSPDGSQIVYLSNRTDDEEAGAWRVWVMNADGSGKQRLPIDLDISYSFGAEQMVGWGR
jgi:uncharacterized protein YraI